MAGSFLTSVAANLVSKVGEYLFAPIGRQFGYVLCYKSYVRDLQNGVEKLETARERVQSSVDEAENDGKSIHKDVENWLKNVKEETEKADDLLKIGASAKIGCFRGWLPNPVVRHPIGRKAKKMTPVIQGLHDESANSNFQKVYYENPPIGKVPAAASDARSVDNKEDVLESRAKIMEEVMKALVDEKVSVVGVWGPGGVGKSKLLDDVKKYGKPFDFIAMAKVSRNPNLKEIQRDIAHQLGLKLTIDEPDQVRASRLRRRLERGPNILIILDDLWKKLELAEIGIPCGDDKISGCKLLLTSRKRDVLRDDMDCDPRFLFQLKELEHDEARRLFERTVGDRINNPDFKHLVDGVVEKCGGLPLLILSVAKKLKHGDIAKWRNASTNINLSDAKSVVELNYNDLEDDRIRLLFLVSALDSGEILIRYSLGYCIGLGIYKKFKTIEDARDMWIMDVHSLQDSSLLLDSDDKEKFRMHDVFGDVAISISSAQMNSLIGKEDYGFKEWSKDELRKCTAISFHWVGIDKLPEKLDCPNLTMFVLAESNPSLKIPESFFESTKKLRVLDFTCLSFTSLPSSIEFLENLKSLYLDYCHLEDVTILGKLKGLQFLSFHGSAIDRLPKEIGGLTELRFLDLTECTRLKIIEPGVLGSLVNLEELYMEDSFDKWEVKDKAPQNNSSLAELKNMKKLSTLYISIPHSAYLPSDLPFGNLNRHKIQIGGTDGWSGEHKESRTLELKLDSGDLLQNVWMQECLGKTQDLCLDGLLDGSDSIHNSCIKGFLELKHLHVKNNFSVQYVVGSTQYPAFTRLESLVLENLNSLEKIHHDCLAPRSLSALKIVKVKNCGAIKHLFHSFMTKNFLQLEEIEITRCHLMKHIVADAESDEYIDEIDDDANAKSFKLRRLTLQNLPEMMSFCKTGDHSVIFLDGQQVSLPWLESLTLSELPKLKEIWNSQFPSDVTNLKFLEVEDCAFLLSIFPSNLVTKLWNLEVITIERCQLIREVFNLEGPIASRDVEISLRLTTLTLSDLPRLGHIWSKNPRVALCFRNLRALKVHNCENLRFLFSSSMAKTLQQVKEIKITSCKLLEEIIDVEEEESEEATSIDTLEFPMLTSLSLEELPNLKTFVCGMYRIHCPTLTRLRISGCPKMMTFSSFEEKQQSMTINTSLQQALVGVNSSLALPAFFNQNVLFPCLEALTVASCGLMKIWHNELSKESFCKLDSITVQDCENLSHIFPSTLMERFRSLKMIEVVKCTSLEALMEHAVVNSKKRQKRMLHCMESLTVKDCPRLRNLFTISEAKSLVQLQHLVLHGCGEMEHIVAREEETPVEAADIIVTPQLVTLDLHNMPKLRSFFQGKHILEWPSLKNFRVGDCKAMEVILGDANCRRPEGSVPTQQPLLLVEKIFPRLETLTLAGKCVGMMPQHFIFGNLGELILKCCHDENAAFPSDFLLHRFPNLETLYVDCSAFKEIFPEDAFAHGEASLKPLGNLKQLHLHELCNLRQAWKDGSLMAEILRQIEFLCVWQCKSLSIVLPSHASFQRLTHLDIDDCAGLVHMGTCSAVTSLVHLTRLTLRNCGAMEDVVTDDGNGAKEISFPKLHRLTLEGLPSLESFSPANCAFTFPSLVHIHVKQCPQMNIFCQGALRTPQLRDVLLSCGDNEGRWKGDLNTTIQHFSTRNLHTIQ